MSPAKRSRQLPSTQVHIFISSNQCRALVQCLTQGRPRGEAEIISVGKLRFRAVRRASRLACHRGVSRLRWSARTSLRLVCYCVILVFWPGVLPERSSISMYI